jgi:methyl-accepting chemotaxis protein
MKKLLPQTVSSRMLALGSVSMLVLALSGVSLYWAGNRIISSQSTIAVNSEALRNHLDMDMLHDSVRGHVYAALSHHETGLDVRRLQEETAEEYKSLELLLDANNKLSLPEEIKVQLAAVRTPLRAYAKSASLILELSQSDRASALSEVKDFEDKFRELEVSLGQVSDRITAHSRSTLDAAGRVSSLATLMFIGLFALIWLSQTLFYMSVRNLVLKPMQTLGRTMLLLAEGKLETNIVGAERGDELGDMARSVAVFRDNAISKNLFESEATSSRQQAEASRIAAESERKTRIDAELSSAREQELFLHTLTEALSRMAAGDLRATLPHASNPMHQAAVDDFNRMTAQVSDIVGRIGQASSSVQSATMEIGAGVSDLSIRTEQQATSLEQTAASMEELAATVRQNADNAQEANQLASASRQLATSGGEIAGRAAIAMDRIEQSSRRVSEIIGLIQEIAFQTNILALNAAVEAARAGDAGRGFAVVANEVRALAQRSAQASKDIKELIATTDASVVEGVQLARQASGALGDITLSIRKVADIVSEIAAASQEQSTGIDQVSRAITDMDEMTQQNAALVEGTNAALNSAKSQIDELQGAVSFFTSDAPNRTPVAIELPPLPKLASRALDVPQNEAGGLHEKLRQLALKMSAARPSVAPAKQQVRKAFVSADWKEF